MSDLTTQEAPMDTLRRIGVTPGAWAQDGGRSVEDEGDACWEITADWLNTYALRDIAYLITEGWAVSIHGRSSRVRVRIDRKAKP